MINDPQSFCFWLQGYSELCGERPSEIQWEMIQEHLQLVFKKETRSLGNIQYCFKPDISSEVNKNGDKIDWSGMKINTNYCGNLKFDYHSEFSFPLFTGIEDSSKYNYLIGATGHPPFKDPKIIPTC